MATIGDYIKVKFSKFRVNLDPVELEVILENAGLSADTVYSKDLMLSVETLILNIIPELLLTPDKQTGDTSLKWDRTAILNYYKLKTKEFGLPDLISEEEQESSITFTSFGG